jgi:uncharacterized protein (DUF433 family)
VLTEHGGAAAAVGLPCIRGQRIPVATVVCMVADSMSEQEILAAYPELEPEDVREAMLDVSCSRRTYPP